jgi:ParB-like chromosome segregation protein Spo0J
MEGTVMDLEFHELADAFPTLDPKEIMALADDIAENTQHEPIVIFEGKVLDGRNRYRACLAAGVEPSSREFDGDFDAARRFVISSNLHRRHLTVEQRSVAAAKLANMVVGGDTRSDHSANLRNGSISQSDAAEMLGVSTRSVTSASKVLKDGAPELVTAMESGEVKVSTAAELVGLPAAEQKKIVAAGAKAVKKAAKARRDAKRKTPETKAAEYLAAHGGGAVVGGLRAEQSPVMAEIDKMLDDAKAPTADELLANIKPSLDAMTDDALITFRDVLADYMDGRGLEPPGTKLASATPPAVDEAAEPAATIKESSGEDRLVCLECGRRHFNTLVRHLNEHHSLTPEGYRAKWRLPADAPMNTPDHARVLSEKGAKRGQKLSSEKRSAAHRGKTQSPETRAKHGAALRGRKIPSEVLAKREATRLANRLAKRAAAEQSAAA